MSRAEKGGKAEEESYQGGEMVGNASSLRSMVCTTYEGIAR